MKELPTPTFPFSLINLPMGALPRSASGDQNLVSSIRAYWNQLTRSAAKKDTAPPTTQP